MWTFDWTIGLHRPHILYILWQYEAHIYYDTGDTAQGMRIIVCLSRDTHIYIYVCVCVCVCNRENAPVRAWPVKLCSRQSGYKTFQKDKLLFEGIVRRAPKWISRLEYITISSQDIIQKTKEKERSPDHSSYSAAFYNPTLSLANQNFKSWQVCHCWCRCKEKKKFFYVSIITARALITMCSVITGINKKWVCRPNNHC